MIDRRLILCREGAPIAWGLFASDIRKAISALPDDLADVLQVWHVPSSEGTDHPAEITKRFALSWAREIDFGDGIDPGDYLAPFPAFVREVCADELRTLWAAKITAHPPIPLPNPLRRVA